MNPRYTRCALRFNHEGDHLFIGTIDPAAHYGECEARDPAEALPPQVDCSWCGRTLSEGTTPISHGICPSCKARLDAEMDTRLYAQ